jgi:hypothetical protein
MANCIIDATSNLSLFNLVFPVPLCHFGSRRPCGRNRLSGRAVDDPLLLFFQGASSYATSPSRLVVILFMIERMLPPRPSGDGSCENQT